MWSCSSDSDMEISTGDFTPVNGHIRVFLIFLTVWYAIFKVSINAINCFLKFFKFFILSLGNSFQVQQLCDVGAAIPSSLRAVHKSLNIKDEFVCYIVCPL